MCLFLQVLQPVRDLVWLFRGGPPPGPAILPRLVGFDDGMIAVDTLKPDIGEVCQPGELVQGQLVEQGRLEGLQRAFVSSQKRHVSGDAAALDGDSQSRPDDKYEEASLYRGT